MTDKSTLWHINDFRFIKNEENILCLEYLISQHGLNGSMLKTVKTLQLPIFPGIKNDLRENIERAIQIITPSEFKKTRFAELTFHWSQLRKHWALNSENDLVKAHWQEELAHTYRDKRKDEDLIIWKLSGFAFVFDVYSYFNLIFRQDTGETTSMTIYLMRPSENAINNIAIKNTLTKGFFQSYFRTKRKRKSQTLRFDFQNIELPKWIILSPEMEIQNAFQEKNLAIPWLKAQ